MLGPRADRYAHTLREAATRHLLESDPGWRDSWHDGLRLNLDDEPTIEALALALDHAEQHRGVAYQIGYRILGPLSLIAAVALVFGLIALGVRWILG